MSRKSGPRDHAVEAHAHDASEILYVLSGRIEIDGKTLNAGEVVFIAAGTAYSARVDGDEGAHVLRVEIPNGDGTALASEYEPRAWRGPLTEQGLPSIP